MHFSHYQKKVFAFVMLISCINFFAGCHRYYRPVEITAATLEKKQTTIKTLADENRYFILRKGTNSYSLKNIVLNQAKMMLTADVGQVPPEHGLYLQNKKSHKYSRGKGQQPVLTEVHLYISDTVRVDTINRYSLSLSGIERIELIERDKGRTTSSYVWGAVGITLGAVLAIALIAVATYEPPAPQPSSDGSCPYISAFTGEKFSLQGEIYSAAIYPSLQKEDYLPVQIQSLKGCYYIKISNELKEVQYTDFADLMIAEHRKDVQLLIDPQGKIHSISKPQLPLKALLNNRTDVAGELSQKDYNSCLFKDGSGEQGREDLYLTFKNHAAKTKGKLVLSARSSSWFNYLYNEFTKGFGSYYGKWVKGQENRPAGELEKWSEEQHIPLTVSVKTAGGWQLVNTIKTIGPLLNREVVVPINLPDGENVEIRVSGGYMFWELDYAAMDFSEDAGFSVKEVKPFEAVSEKGISVLPELEFADKKYLVQQNTGDSTILKYRAAEAKEGMTQSFFFHTSGYYNHPRQHSGTPKVAFLKSFSKPGALSVFSKQRFAEAWNSLEIAKR